MVRKGDVGVQQCHTNGQNAHTIKTQHVQFIFLDVCAQFAVPHGRVVAEFQKNHQHNAYDNYPGGEVHKGFGADRGKIHYG